MKKIVVIIPNELETNIPLFVSSCDNDHCEKLREFMYQNDFSLLKDARITSQEIAFSLGEQGFCVLLGLETSDIKNLIAFLPNKVSPKQYEYFSKRESGFKKYDFSFFEYTDNENWNIVDKTTFTGNIIEELLERLKQKLIAYSKIKKRTDK